MCDVSRLALIQYLLEHLPRNSRSCLKFVKLVFKHPVHFLSRVSDSQDSPINGGSNMVLTNIGGPADLLCRLLACLSNKPPRPGTLFRYRL
ncbi:hypothetical protein APHAL10511_008173 [Amanita phalloides]|nr:hypothetical protein APHAL10511_008173 [Amanita phalloides]